jgi:hypothetical protein
MRAAFSPLFSLHASYAGLILGGHYVVPLATVTRNEAAHCLAPEATQECIPL